jgi:glutathione S-transferase
MTNMILYHFGTSPFARRVRLVLAHKSCSVELRDPRANPELQPDQRYAS